jgi:hypothetical protein
MTIAVRAAVRPTECELARDVALSGPIDRGGADRSEQQHCREIAAEMARIRVPMQKFRRAAKMVPAAITLGAA